MLSMREPSYSDQIRGHVAGIEAGGTKFVCATAKDSADLLNRTRIPTQDPKATYAAVVAYLQAQEQQNGPLDAIGLASFGPLDVNPSSAEFGRMGNTPKPGWPGFDMLAPLREHFAVPLALQTDVNGSALGESLWGAGRGLDSVLYITIGTGIGGGALHKGYFLGQLAHSEMGHIRLAREAQDASFAGICPAHGDCFEGLASGPAIKARWGQPAETLPADHPAWVLEAAYIAQALFNYILILFPQRVILGGGVMRQPQLWPLIREQLAAKLGDYVPLEKLDISLEDWIVPPTREGDSALLGALALASGQLAAQETFNKEELRL